MAKLSHEMVAAEFRQRDDRIYGQEEMTADTPDRDPVISRIGINALRQQLASRRQALLARTQEEMGRLSVSR